MGSPGPGTAQPRVSSSANPRPANSFTSPAASSGAGQRCSLPHAAWNTNRSATGRPARNATASGVFAAGFIYWWDHQPGFVRLPFFATRRRRQLVRVAVERRELIRIFDKARADFLAAGPVGSGS